MDPSRRVLVKMMYYSEVRLGLWPQQKGVSENDVLQWSYTRFMDPSRRMLVLHCSTSFSLTPLSLGL